MTKKIETQIQPATPLVPEIAKGRLHRLPTFGSTRKFTILTAITLSASLLSGCAQGAGAEGTTSCASTGTIGFSHSAGEAAAVKAIKRDLQDAADENGCVKLLLDNTTGSSLEAQRATIEGWVTQQVDAIVIFPVDPAAFKNLQAQAQAQGTKWLTYASSMTGEDGGVGFDSDKSGALLADDLEAWLKKNHPNGGISAAVTTFEPLGTIAGRWNAPLAALDKAGIPVVSKQDCPDQACGLQIAEDALRENPNLRVFIGVNDDAALGAKKAFDNAGIDPSTVYIGGYDGTEEGLAAIKEGGAFRASVALQLNSLAQEILNVSMAAIKGDGTTTALTPVVLATADDPAGLDKLLSQYGSK